MKALRFTNGRLTVAAVPRPERPDHALVRVKRAGICATDVAITRGYAGFSGTLGHEFVGVVERSPDPAWIGKRVVGEINLGCGDCRPCRGGDSRHCALRTVLGIRDHDGAFAEYLTLPLRNLRLVPDTVPDRAAVFAEPLAAACRIHEQLTIHPDQSVIVLGDGKLAQLIGRVLVANGLSPMMVGKHPEKLALAEAAGCTTRHLDRIDAGDDQTADVVIEATGRPAGFALALRLVKPTGTIVLKSTFHGEWAIESAAVVVPEITIVGSRCGRIEHALDLLAAKLIDVEPLITAEFDLSDGIAAFTAAQSPGAMKIHLLMGD